MSGLSKTSRNAVIAVMVISLVLLFASMTSPLLGYIAASYPTENFFLLVQVPGLVGTAVSFLVGPMAMKINMKWLMVICAVSALTYFLVFTFIGSNGPWIALVIGAGIVGICQGAAMVLTSSVFGAYVVDPGQRANFVAISGALMNGGAAVVNIVGGWLAAGNGGADWPKAYMLGLLIIPALIVFWIFMPLAPDAQELPMAADDGQGGPPPAPVATGFIPVKVFLIIGMGLIVSLGMGVFLMNVGTYITGELGIGKGYGYTTIESGMANALFTILGVVAGFSYPIISRPLGRMVTPIGYAVGAAGLAVCFLFPSNILYIYIGAGMCGLGFNIAMPYVMGQMMAITPPRWIPVAMSINMGAMNLAMSFVPNIFGFLGSLADGTIASQIMIGASLVVVGVVCSVFLFVFWKTPAPQE